MLFSILCFFMLFCHKVAQKTMWSLGGPKVGSRRKKKEILLHGSSPPLFKGGSLGFLNVKKGGTLPKLKIKGGRSFDGGISTKVI